MNSIKYVIYISKRYSGRYTTIKVYGTEAAYALYRKAVDRLSSRCYICLCDGETGEILNGVLD